MTECALLGVRELAAPLATFNSAIPTSRFDHYAVRIVFANPFVSQRISIGVARGSRVGEYWRFRYMQAEMNGGCSTRDMGTGSDGGSESRLSGLFLRARVSCV